jgi:glycosyltransferase involved in cell wall biosynthesis
MPEISIITATHRPDAPYLHETYNSILRQTETNWEWLIQYDGATWEPPAWLRRALTDDPRVQLHLNGQYLGIAMTRNRALSRAQGRYIQVLDADDQLTPHALEKLKNELAADPELSYAIGCIVKYRSADESQPQTLHLPFGKLEPGTIGDFWLENGKMPLHASSGMWDRRTLIAHGGWTAIHVSEDTAVALAISEQHAGIFIEHPTFIYRVHENSTVHHPDYWTVHRSTAHVFVREQILAIRAMHADAKRTD